MSWDIMYLFMNFISIYYIAKMLPNIVYFVMDNTILHF